MKILVFGGTFNPVHNGHKLLCTVLAEKVGADKIIIVPAYLPVHKTVGGDLASAEDRLNMCRIAFRDVENCEVTDIEIKKNRACYSVDTLTEIKNMYINCEIYFACGSDMFLCLDTWKDTEKLFSLATFCAAPRKDEYDKMVRKGCELSKKGLKYIILDCEYINVSSTQIREKIKSGNYNNMEIDNEVLKYIKDRHIYGA